MRIQSQMEGLLIFQYNSTGIVPLDTGNEMSLLCICIVILAAIVCMNISCLCANKMEFECYGVQSKEIELQIFCWFAFSD